MPTDLFATIKGGRFELSDFIELREKLEAGAIRWDEAIALFDSKRYRPWDTKEWKIRRDSRIGPRCIKCGKTKELVLQHTRQPRKPKTLIEQYKRLHRESISRWLDEHPPRLDLAEHDKSANACTKCGSQTIRERWTLGNWLCVAVSNGVRCGHVFQHPVKQVPNAIVRDLEEAADRAQVMNFLAEKGLGKEIAAIAIDDMIRYLELHHTKTLCKSCAFYEDKVERRKRKWR